MKHLIHDLWQGFERLEILCFSTKSKQKGEGVKTYVIHGWSLCICTHHRHHIRDHKRLYESSPRSSGVWWSGTIILLVAPPPFRKSKPKNGILLPKLFCPTVRKKCSGVREKTLEIRDWKLRICKFFNITRTLIFKQWKVRTIFGNRMLFQLVPGGFSYLIN